MSAAADAVPFDERIARLSAVTASAPVVEDGGLVKTIPIQAAAHARICAALNAFLWACLANAFPEKSFALTDDMLAAYEADILRLPNITPNGLVLPKRENILAFNLLQKEVVEAFAALGLGAAIARLQFPVNIRLQSGMPNPAIDSRPRASVKPHSDIWAGDPASGILVFLSVLGNPRNSGIDFLQPRRFPLSFVRPLDDYNEGAEVVRDARTVARFSDKGWFLADPYLIHKTTKNGAGYRISLDFRFIPHQRAPLDGDEDDARKPYFISFAEWASLGTKKLVMTEEGMHEFSAAKSKDPYTVGYPVRLSLLDTAPQADPRQQKLAS